MKCPNCSEEMEQGWLAVFNPLAWLTSVVWQPERPGWVRFRVPPGGERVLVPQTFGRGNPRAGICRPCQTVSFCFAPGELDRAALP